MRAMANRKTVVEGVAAGVVAIALAGGLAACGGEAKQADSPGMCPEGTVLHGTDCLPASSDKDPDEKMPPSTASSNDSSSGSASGGGAASGGGPASSGDSAPSSEGKTPYDKDAVEAQLKRGARSVKASCGASTDDNGDATGPWGKTQAAVTLGRNGHVKQVAVPAPYDGTPAGLCVVHAFDKIQFPPYAASSDITVQWDVELVKPKK
jgi:hypothetical protein